MSEAEQFFFALLVAAALTVIILAYATIAADRLGPASPH